MRPEHIRREQGKQNAFLIYSLRRDPRRIAELNGRRNHMAKRYELIDDKLAAWIGRQRVFFVATAPLDRDGHVNCSPKGGSTFQVIDPATVAYQDLTGSGAETIAHLRENGRIVIMFCSFEGPPKILRLHGLGEAVIPGDEAFGQLSRYFAETLGTRAVIRVRLTRISDSCGYGVPLMEYGADRDAIGKWAQAKGPGGLKEYRQKNNVLSVDGLPALDGLDPQGVSLSGG